MTTPDPHAPLDPPPDLPGYGSLPTAEKALVGALGSQILMMAVLDLDHQASELIRRTTAVCGPMAVLDQMLLWIDTFLGLAGYKCTCPDHHDRPRPVELSFVDLDTGETSDTDEVPPEVRWSGRIISARAVGDIDVQAALFASLPRDPAAQGRHVLALLQTVACQLRVLAGKEGPVPGV